MCSPAGLIYPIDTFTGFHKIGFNPLLAFFAIFVIHGTFSYPSQPGWLPDPLFSLNTANMHRCKHGSDSETYDTEGRYVPVSVVKAFNTAYYASFYLLRPPGTAHRSC